VLLVDDVVPSPDVVLLVVDVVVETGQAQVVVVLLVLLLVVAPSAVVVLLVVVDVDVVFSQPLSFTHVLLASTQTILQRDLFTQAAPTPRGVVVPEFVVLVVVVVANAQTSGGDDNRVSEPVGILPTGRYSQS
jgi:hypothetical protein